MKTIGWRVWYENGEQYNSSECDWSNLPDDGVQEVVVYFDEKEASGVHHYRRNMTANNWYFQAQGPNGYFYASSDDPPEEIRHRYKNAVLIRGKWTDEDTLIAIEKKARKIRDVP